MNLKERILEQLQRESHMSDRELADRILGMNSPQQTVNQACRQLQQQGLIKRTLPPIKNYLISGAVEKEEFASAPKLNKEVLDSGLGEERIKQILNDYLLDNGWTTAVAWEKKHGIDIEARKGNERWIIEVKGCGSLNPMRVNYFVAILGETIQRMNDPDARYSIALPDMKQFRNLWERLPLLAKQRTTIDAIFIKDEKHIDFVK